MTEESFVFNNESDAASTALPLAVIFPETVMPCCANRSFVLTSTIQKNKAGIDILINFSLTLQIDLPPERINYNCGQAEAD